MKLFVIVAALGLVILLFSCKSKPKYASLAESAALENSISFGNYGGFSGAKTSYTILNNGQFFYQAPRTKTTREIKEIKGKTAKQLFKNISSLGIDQMELNDPGNMTNFLHFNVDGVSKKLEWGGMNKEVPQNLKLLYTNLMQIAKNTDKNAVK